MTDDLARLTQQMRDAARELAPTQPAASTKLRGALEGMDENDLGTRMQRSSDWLRSGNFSDPAETALTSDLQKLGQQVGDAARALGSGSAHFQGRRAQPRHGRSIPSARPTRRPRRTSQLSTWTGSARPAVSRPQAGQLSNGQAGQSGQAGQQGQRSRRPRRSSRRKAVKPAEARRVTIGNRIAGPVGNPGGGAANRDGNGYGGYDTGNTRISGQAVAPQQGPNPADTQREIDQGLNLLNQVRAAVQDSPEARQQLQSLIDQMRNLDPSRFPGNPALVEQMHQQLVSSVDALELQLRRQLDENQGGTIRNTDPAKVPAGYQDSVAEYYRKLSGGGHQ